MTFDVEQYGATGDGTSDDTTAIQDAITACQNGGGGVVSFPPGIFLLSGQLSITAPNVTLAGAGHGATIIRPAANYAPSKIIFINNADFCGVRDLQISYANTSSSGNPTADGIQISQGRYARIRNVEAFYLGGWFIQSIGSTGKSNLGTIIENVHALHCAKGIHLQSKQTNWPGQHFLVNINMEIIDSGDCLFMEDIDDCVVNGFLGAVNSASSGSALHIKGAGASDFFFNVDIGAFPGNGGAPTCLIESSANGSPSNVIIQGGVIQQGAVGLRATAGKQITISGIKFGGNSGSGADLQDPVQSLIVENCTFVGNGAIAGAGRYSINVATTNAVFLRGNLFQDNIGSSANHVNGLVNDVNHVSQVTDNVFSGTGVTPSTAFNSLPAVIRGNKGYNPVGAFTAPAIPSSSIPLTNPFNVDCTVFIAGGTVSAVAIGGTATGLTSGAFSVPAGQSIAITYSASPSWVWIGE
jgi:hypothetical protein